MKLKLNKLVIENSPEMKNLFKQKKSLEAEISGLEARLNNTRKEYKSVLEKIINTYEH
jgi:predicted  nucleic acid-binding Zn-ribbon protein